MGKWKLLTCIWFFATPWSTTVHGILQARILEWVAFPLLQGIFPTQGLNPGLLHCRWILYQLSHKGSPRILEWVAYPFSRGSSWSRNQARVNVGKCVYLNWCENLNFLVCIRVLIWLSSLSFAVRPEAWLSLGPSPDLANWRWFVMSLASTQSLFRWCGCGVSRSNRALREVMSYLTLMGHRIFGFPWMWKPVRHLAWVARWGTAGHHPLLGWGKTGAPLGWE